MEKQGQLSSSEQNQAFEKSFTLKDDRLLRRGEHIYHQLKENPEEALYKFHSYAFGINQAIEILIEQESKEIETKLHQTKIILNGIMDAAGENNDPQICMKTKDILEGFFYFPI